jgi:hypothetical protein
MGCHCAVGGRDPRAGCSGSGRGRVSRQLAGATGGWRGQSAAEVARHPSPDSRILCGGDSRLAHGPHGAVLPVVQPRVLSTADARREKRRGPSAERGEANRIPRAESPHEVRAPDPMAGFEVGEHGRTPPCALCAVRSAPCETARSGSRSTRRDPIACGAAASRTADPQPPGGRGIVSRLPSPGSLPPFHASRFTFHRRPSPRHA